MSRDQAYERNEGDENAATIDPVTPCSPQEPAKLDGEAIIPLAQPENETQLFDEFRAHRRYTNRHMAQYLASLRIILMGSERPSSQGRLPCKKGIGSALHFNRCRH